jgi:septal ring factor EnvC (AmiA/AmiB activator)
MKILNDNKFIDLKTKADNFELIVAAMLDSSDNMKEEDISADVIIEALKSIDESDDSQLNAEIDALKSQLSDLQMKLTAAETKIKELEAELDSTPAAPTATIVAKGEPSADPMDIIDFARKNADNPFLVLEEMKKQQLI